MAAPGTSIGLLPSGVRTLLARLALFLSPLGLVVLLLEVVLWTTGESWPLARVLEAQDRNRDAIFMRGVLDQSLSGYKWRGVLERRPEVLALGSSRVMKFRAEMFGEDASGFYNAGGLVTSVADLEAFVKRLPADRTPRLIILGMDSWWLRPGRPSGETFRISHDGALSWQEHLLALRSLFRDPRFVRAALESLGSGSEAGGIGIHARARGQGFRFDGSLESVRPTRKGRGSGFVDPERPTTVRKIRTGVGFFKPAPAISGARLQGLRAGLMGLRERGILVVGFAPPLCSEAVELLESDPRHRRFWSQYLEALEDSFRELGMPYVDASSPGLLGLDDRYMIDGIHGGETLYVHILRRMLDDPRVAEAVPAAASVVEAAIRSSRTTFWSADIPDDVAWSEPSGPDEG